MIKTVSLAAIVAMTASASFAGSLNTTYEAEPEQEYTVAPVGSSGIGVPVVIGGVLAAAAIAALVSNDDDAVSDHPEPDLAD